MLRALVLLCLFVPVLVAACSDTDLRAVYEEPPRYAQPTDLGPTEWADEFTQRAVEAADILFVVDDSCSMEGEQLELRSNFDNFISSFVETEVDYHVGVVRAALDGGDDNYYDWGILEPLDDGTRWISQDTGTTHQDKIDAFNELSDVGTGGGGCEMALQASKSALSYQGALGQDNEGFYREDALLSLVLISDEPDRGEDTFPLVCDGVGPSEYIDWLTDLKWPYTDRLIFTSIVGPRPDGCTGSDDNSAEEGDGYWDVIDAVDGNFLSICSDDWSEFLTELGLESAGLKRSFHLRRVPDQDTLSITIDGETPDPAVWEYNRIANAIDFPSDYFPPELSVLRATYYLAEDADTVLGDAGDDGDSGS